MSKVKQYYKVGCILLIPKHTKATFSVEGVRYVPSHLPTTPFIRQLCSPCKFFYTYTIVTRNVMTLPPMQIRLQYQSANLTSASDLSRLRPTSPKRLLPASNIGSIQS